MYLYNHFSYFILYLNVFKYEHSKLIYLSLKINNYDFLQIYSIFLHKVGIFNLKVFN